MATINALLVLNTVKDNGGDFIFDENNNLNITGLPAIKSPNIRVKKIAAVTEQKKKQLVTFTSANSTTYTFDVVGYDTLNSTTGNLIQKVVPITYTSPASSSADIVSAAITAAFNAAASGFSVSAADQASSSGAVLFSAAAGYPDFVVQESDTNIAVQTVATVAFTASPNGNTATGIVVVNDAGEVTSILLINKGSGYAAAPTVTFTGGASNTSGGATGTAVITKGEVTSVTIGGAGSANKSRGAVSAIGTTAALQVKFGGTTQGGGVTGKPFFPGVSDLATSATYTEWDLTFETYTDNPSYALPVMKQTYVLLINNAATTAGSDLVTINLALLQDPTYGALPLLNKGWKTTVTPSVTVQAGITTVTGVITLDGGTNMNFSTLGAMPGDFLVITQAGGTAWTTLYSTKIQSMGATQYLAIGDNVVALPASTEDFKYIAVRVLPN